MILIFEDFFLVSVQSDLQDEEKRWLVVGICLHSIISPVLRTFIGPVMKKLYKKLKKSHSIDTQTHPNVLLEYPQPPQPKRYKLNYESINNNRQHGKKGQKLFDYKVKDALDLSKLFILPHMAHYSGFDESCDSSVLLGLLINIDYKFQPPLKLAADKVGFQLQNKFCMRIVTFILEPIVYIQFITGIRHLFQIKLVSNLKAINTMQ